MADFGHDFCVDLLIIDVAIKFDDAISETSFGAKIHWIYPPRTEDEKLEMASVLH